MRLKKSHLVIIVLLLALIAFGIWSWQRNSYSKEVLKLEILGPESVEAGEVFEYVVKYKNNGSTLLQSPKLIFEYPKQAFVIPKEDSSWQEKSLDDIYPGEERTVSFKGMLVDKEGEMAVAKASLSYQPKDLKARYESNTTFTTIVKTVPLVFELDLPSKVEPGKDFTFKVNYFSNAKETLTDLRVQLEYPSGFEFVSSNPQSLERNEWIIPLLNRNEGGSIEVTGRISDQLNTAKIFKANLGILKNGEFIFLKEITKGAETVKPSIYLRQEINGNPEYIAASGQWLHYEIYIKNIGEEEIKDLFIVCELEGEPFDFQTIRSETGQTMAGLNSVIFDWKDSSHLQYLLPMEEEKIDFWIKLKSDFGEVKNPSLKNKISINQFEEEFTTKVSSKIALWQKGYFQSSYFENEGPIPPKVGETTTYTILWQVRNYYSTVKEAKVRAVLPRGVELTGEILPEEVTKSFYFDPQTREVVFAVGELAPGDLKTIVFQVAFTPEESQIGKSPEIIGEARVSGEDTWTESVITAIANSVNTTLPDDSTITEEKEIVQ